MIDPTAYIHPLAHVSDSSLGARTKVWQFASITRDTVLGEDCSVAPFALLDGPKIGDRTIISMHAAIGPGFVIGSDVFVGPSVTFANDAWPRADKTGFDADALRDGSLVAIRVGDGASIGANAVILPGVRLGEGCMIAAGAVVTCDVPAGHLFTRDRDLVEIKPHWTERRMRACV